MTTSSFGVLAGALLASLLSSSCSRAAAQFGSERLVALSQRPVEFGLEQEARFGLRPMGVAKKSQEPAASTQGQGAAAFEGDAPASWQVANPSEFRQLNYRIGDGGECYLTAGNLRGGALANANRWISSQFGQPALTDAQFAALPTHTLLGADAKLVEIEGDYRGMGGDAKSGYKLLGLVGGADENLVTLKFTGPKALLDEHRAAFLAFAKSLRRSSGAGATAATGSTPAASAPPAGAFAAVVGDGYAAMVPGTWKAETPSQFRLLNFKIAGSECECYLTAGGLRGGLLGNANRWVASQFRQEALTETQFAALPRHPLLDGKAALVELQGDFQGMGGEAKSGYGLLGLIGGTDEEMVTWKMVGPREVVEREKANFLAVAASIREGEKPGTVPSAVTAPPANAPKPQASPTPAGAAFAATIPSGWTAAGDSGSRQLFHRFGDGGECYVGQLGGEPGQMVGIWYSEFGQTAPDAAGLAALPKIPMLGGEAMLVGLTGSHTGMSGQKREGMQLLVAVKQTDKGVVFCKLLGKTADVEANRAGFLQFCATLKRNDG